MFVYNVKLSSKNLLKISFALMVIVITIIFFISIYNIIAETFKVKDEITSNEINYIEPNNYANILKYTYENLDSYIGKKVCFIGYIYKPIDLKEDEFVLARDMTTDSEFKTLIIGFLCKCKRLNSFNDGDWVEITGTIDKTIYHTEIPIIKISEIKNAQVPENPLVPPPDDTYIPTSLIF